MESSTIKPSTLSGWMREWELNPRSPTYEDGDLTTGLPRNIYVRFLLRFLFSILSANRKPHISGSLPGRW